MTLLDLIVQIKRWEGFRSKPYRDSGGTWTIGYGCIDSKIIKKGYISEKEASDILTKKVINVYEDVCIIVSKYKIKVTNPATLYALTDFAYNLGMGNLKKLLKPSILKPVRSHKEIKKAIPLYCKCKGKTLAGLVKRRNWEVNIYGD